RITDYGLRITDYGLRITDYGLRITDYGLRIIFKHLSPMSSISVFRKRSALYSKTPITRTYVYH
ncbi:hypothetical protein, partial [Vibrio sp.]|uniref:hypothetical protein n=1 Tax=Vibrio sp. TaxID=678 RepID=UPI003AA8C1BF